MNICDLCIAERVVFRRIRDNKAYCQLEENVQGLTRKYGELTPDDDESDYNFKCKYLRGIGREYKEAKKFERQEGFKNWKKNMFGILSKEDSYK